MLIEFWDLLKIRGWGEKGLAKEIGVGSIISRRKRSGVGAGGVLGAGRIRRKERLIVLDVAGVRKGVIYRFEVVGDLVIRVKVE